MRCNRLPVASGQRESRAVVKRIELIRRTALPLLLCAGSPAFAQEAVPPAPAVEEEAPEITFSADELIYEEPTDTVIARGDVRMVRESYRLAAETVIWNRGTGEVRAEGDVRIVSPGGDVAYGDSVVLTDTLREGMVENLLIVLEDGGRLAAMEASRIEDRTVLYRASYTACAVVTPEGCPKDPTWQINAVRVVHDPVENRISYEGATLNLFGTPILGLPGLSHPDGTAGGGTGLLVPDIRYSRQNGLELSVPYYVRLAPNRDFTITPHVHTEALPMLEGEYRQLTSLGAFQLHGYLTYGSRVRIRPDGLVPAGESDTFRGYFEGNGRFQLNPFWSVTGSGRYVTDRTFLRRYDISRDTRLRSMIDAERIAADSYISIAGWAFQGLRMSDVGGVSQPVVLPAIDARWRMQDPWAGGTLEVRANSLSILRTEGQDTQRAFASARWERRSITGLGHELLLTAFARGDVYHANDTFETQTLIYRGEEGFSGRFIGALAADLKWPLIGEFVGGVQRLTPRVQVVASPPTENLEIPNEDARAVDLEDSNLFALNRFPGHDRWEDGVRITYGADWALDLPGAAIRSNIGQSYRLSSRETILPPGTGLSGRFSDIVGRTTVRLGRGLNLVHRFRLDKDNFAIRRNEIDAVVGGPETYATVGYLRLNRDIDPAIEDLRDREEVRVGGRVRFARFWSVFGSAVVDLTGQEEDPLSSADGFDPIRHRLGILYDDECIELGVTWRRDYESAFDIERGNTFLIRVALKNLGR